MHAKADRIVKEKQENIDLPRQWIHQFVDPGSFMETDAASMHHSDGPGMERYRREGDGVVAGIARVGRKPVAVYAQDPTFMGGALGKVQADKICRVLDLAARERYPVISLIASGGARIQEGVDSLSGYGEIFYRTVALSGKVPQISIAMGTCAGGAVYQPALTDLVVMIKNTSRMFITGPTIVESVTHEKVTPEQLGGWHIHAHESGLCSLVAEDVEDAFRQVRRVLSYLDPSRRSATPVARPALELDEQPVPLDSRSIYDVLELLGGIVDAGSFVELHRNYAKNIVTGFARIDGQQVGIVANQPKNLGGVLNSNASRKGARFVRLCNSFGLPVVTFVDCPGYMPGISAEAEGVTVHGAKLLQAYCEAEVPKYTIVTRKSYGGAHIVLGSRSVGATCFWAWPHAEIGVMGARGAVNLLKRRDLAASDDPEALRSRLEEEYTQTILDPREAARKGQVDRIIEPSHTRAELSRALSFGSATPSHTKAFPF